MFTGIVQGTGKMVERHDHDGLMTYAIEVPPPLTEGLQIGASVAIDGICQTATKIDGSRVWFDAIPETLAKTNLGDKIVGSLCNVERAAKVGDEIGGHNLSGHVGCVAQLIERREDNSFHFQCPKEWARFLFSKGFIALNGCSLTLVDVDQDAGTFSVHLIPETLRVTTFGLSQPGDLINVEVDSQTQVIVETTERVVRNMHISS